MWNDRVVLDHRGIPIRDLVLPLTISSKIGEEEARLEAMLRSNTNIGWGDIFARIFRRGDTLMKIRIIRNQLNMRLVRFHVTARLISWNPKSGSEALETCLLSIMTAEMIAKNSTKGLPDLVEPARLQYRKAIMVLGRFGAWQPIFTTNPNKSYWQQLETLQNAFEQHWTEVGHGGRPPTLYGLLKVDYDSMTWNAMDIPNLAVVWQNIDSANRTFAHWQHRQIALDRAKLVQRHRELDDEEKKLRNAWEHKDDEGQDKLRMEKEKYVEEDAVIEEGGPVEEDVMEVEREGEEEL